MLPEQIREAIARIHSLEREMESLSAMLRGLGVDLAPLVDYERLKDLREKLERELEIQHALARVDFEDDYYTFVRAIDGDTIVVEPPSSLRQWMKDLHVRLYGLETPELWEELGPEYRQHLESLCAVDGRGRLRIVWERERMGTNYAGYPLSSFDRGIGHVFYEVFHPRYQGRYMYLNGLMHVLRHASLRRKGELLLRGKRFLERWPIRMPYLGGCLTPIVHIGEEASETLRFIHDMNPPTCLLVYPKLPNLDPRSSSLVRAVVYVLERMGADCPVSRILSAERVESVAKMVEEQKMSAFDVPLVLLSQWALAQYNTDDPNARRDF